MSSVAHLQVCYHGALHSRTLAENHPGCDAEVEAEEKRAEAVSWPKNANLGRFTNFVNLMDLAAIAIPSGLLRCEPPTAASDPTGQLQPQNTLIPWRPWYGHDEQSLSLPAF